MFSTTWIRLDGPCPACPKALGRPEAPGDSPAGAAGPQRHPAAGRAVHRDGSGDPAKSRRAPPGARRRQKCPPRHPRPGRHRGVGLAGDPIGGMKDPRGPAASLRGLFLIRL